ncbi:glycosyltransferase family 1 protein, partial [Aureobasidium melanogenum]
MSDAPSSRPRKVCFVTIGATASFSALIRATLSSSFCHSLEQNHYTDLIVQYGADGDSLFQSLVKDIYVDQQHAAINVSGFGLDTSGLAQYMNLAKTGGDDGGIEGLVVSHAGSGTILDALRVDVPLVVVPNSELLDNHQVELADALAEQEYVVHGKLEDLPQALLDAEKLRLRKKAWPPINSGTHRQTKGLAAVVDEEMGFLVD